MANNYVNNSRIAKNTMFLYLRMFLVLLVSLYTTRVVLNALGVVDYGINNVVAGFVTMFAFLNTSMSNGIQRYYNFKLGKEGEESLTMVYNTALLIQLLLALLIFFLLETIGLWYLYNKMVIPTDRFETALWLFQFSTFSLLLVVFQIPFSAAIMAHERMDYYAYVSIIEVALKLAVAFCLPRIYSDRLFAYGCFHLGISIIIFSLYFIYSKYHFNSLRLKFSFHKDLFLDMLSFSWWNIFGTFAYMLKNQGLNVLLNAFFGPVVNAARGVSMMINNAIHGFQTNIVISFRPQTVQSYAEGDLKRVKSLMFSLSKISYLMLFMLSMPVIIELSYILHIWLGNSVPEYTVPFTVLILLIMILSSLNTPLSQVVHATGKMKFYQIGTSIVICSILPIAWLFLKLGSDPTSVYIVSLVMSVLNQVVCLVLLKRIFPYSISEYVKEVIMPCVFVTAVASMLPIIVHLILPSSFIRLLLVILLGVSSTIVFSFYFVMNKGEKKMIVEMINKYIKRK